MNSQSGLLQGIFGFDSGYQFRLLRELGPAKATNQIDRGERKKERWQLAESNLDLETTLESYMQSTG